MPEDSVLQDGSEVALSSVGYKDIIKVIMTTFC